MSEDFFKLLALIFCAGVGYLYAWRKHKDEQQSILNRVLREEQNDKAEIKEIIGGTSTHELIRHANERLRKRRASDDDN